MKPFLFVLTFVATIFLTSCSSGDSKSNSAEKNMDQEKPILNVKDFVGKSLSEVEQIIGKADKIEKVKGYPCEKSKCERAFFEKEKYEVIFKRGKVDRITINDTPDFTSDNQAIEKLGLPLSEPSFKNPGNVVRWSSTEGIHEVNFFTDYIYVIINSAD